MAWYHRTVELPETANVPISLYKSMQGKYFVGYADNLDFTGPGVNAWASLYNPPNSGVNLYVNVWTATSLYGIFRAQIWFNARMPGTPRISSLVTVANTSIDPIPTPKGLLLEAANTTGEPSGGVKAFVRRGGPENTLTSEVGGRYIFGPGGSFSILLSNPETPEEPASGRVAFGWWEEPICTF
ncbi:MAG: hypothetical protein K0Q48_719 [Bacillota bacterium]|jgi:hypothetical protein|nr:hypothetical protein [Bacillota bacterium]